MRRSQFTEKQIITPEEFRLDFDRFDRAINAERELVGLSE